MRRPKRRHVRDYVPALNRCERRTETGHRRACDTDGNHAVHQRRRNAVHRRGRPDGGRRWRQRATSGSVSQALHAMTACATALVDGASFRQVERLRGKLELRLLAEHRGKPLLERVEHRWGPLFAHGSSNRIQQRARRRRVVAGQSFGGASSIGQKIIGFLIFLRTDELALRVHRLAILLHGNADDVGHSARRVFLGAGGGNGKTTGAEQRNLFADPGERHCRANISGFERPCHNPAALKAAPR